MEEQEDRRLEGYVDWRNRQASKIRHGGLRGAVFVLVSEVFENLAFIANASNLVTYCISYMHFPSAQAANTVTNFMGSSFILALLGGFISDGFFMPFKTVLSFTAVEFTGMILLTMQAHYGSLRPASCSERDLLAGGCEEASKWQKALFYGGLYLVALGVGGLKGSLPVHGAHQLDDEEDAAERKLRSNFFNWFLFSMCTGSLVAVTFVVWVQDNKGWQWGFGISTFSLLLLFCVFFCGVTFYRNKMPQGSPLTRIAQVFVAAAVKKKALATQSRMKAVHESYDKQTDSQTWNASAEIIPRTPQFRCLDKAAIPDPNHAGPTEESPWKLCTITQVEDVKTILRVLPIFASTIIMNCCLAQLQTFSVKQASTMNRKIGSFTVPSASLTAIPVICMLILIPFYDQVLVPWMRRLTNRETGITHLQRVGFGLVLSVCAMAVAALVETKRKKVATLSATSETETVPMTFMWVGIQYLLLGVADMFVLAGLMEFFYTEAPRQMRSVATALSWASTALGYFLSSVLVDLVNEASRRVDRRGRGWLDGSDLDGDHLERFYWLLCALGAANFGQYVFWSVWYRYGNPHQHVSDLSASSTGG